MNASGIDTAAGRTGPELRDSPLAQALRGTGDKTLVAVFVLAYAIVLLRTAWLCDDAYITFRTIENFLAGYGLTWNTGERVQAYTHPLWLLLISALRLASREIYYTVLVTSMALSLAAVLVVAFAIARTRVQTLLAVAILASSKAFVDYSTSGLENPLSYLLLALFLRMYLPQEAMTPRRLLRLSLLTGLIVLNRMDLLLLVAPALAHVLWQTQGSRSGQPSLGRIATSLLLILLGFLPFIAWEIFSVIYYGFPFPNTAYAKLNTGIPAAKLIGQGLNYFANSLRFDPVTLPAITAALLASVLTRRRSNLALAIGLFPYGLYILKIGGDFMSGRFFAVPLLVAVVILAMVRLPRRVELFTSAAAVPIVILLGLCGPWPSLLSDSRFDWDPQRSLDAHEIGDERASFYQATGLLRGASPLDIPTKPAARLGMEAARNNRRLLTGTIVMGMSGYYAGPKVHIVDILALPDPLLARLPVPEGYCRIGHFQRFVPDGYYEGLRSGRNELTDLRLRQFNERVRLITTGPIFNLARLRTILDMNLGGYQDVVDTEYYRHPPPRLHTGPYSTQEDRWTALLNLRLPAAGVWIHFGMSCHTQQLEIAMNGSHPCRILYPQGADEPIEQPIPPGPPETTTQTVQIPERVSRTGFDRLLLMPAKGDDMCYIRQVRILDPPSSPPPAP